MFGHPAAEATWEESHGNQNVGEVSRLFFAFLSSSRLQSFARKEAGVCNSNFIFQFQQIVSSLFFIFLFIKFFDPSDSKREKRRTA